VCAISDAAVAMLGGRCVDSDGAVSIVSMDALEVVSIALTRDCASFTASVRSRRCGGDVPVARHSHAQVSKCMLKTR
jgi:hypothetical protein